MEDISIYLKPKVRLEAEDGLAILQDSRIALEAIGKKLNIMRKLAAYAAKPECDPVKRMELNLVFKQLAKEIDDWAQCSTGGVQVMNGGN